MSSFAHCLLFQDLAERARPSERGFSRLRPLRLGLREEIFHVGEETAKAQGGGVSRASLSAGWAKGRAAREDARDLGRFQSSVVDEVRRNCTVTRGSGKRTGAGAVPMGVCARLLA